MVYYKNRYHVFFQHYPYDSVWGAMHWGHLVTDDLEIFAHSPLRLRPIKRMRQDASRGARLLIQKIRISCICFIRNMMKKTG